MSLRSDGVCGVSLFSEIFISKAAFCYPDVKFVTFRTGDGINKVPCGAAERLIDTERFGVTGDTGGNVDVRAG